MIVPTPQPSDDALVIEHENLDRFANAVVTIVPFALLGLAVCLACAAGRGLAQTYPNP